MTVEGTVRTSEASAPPEVVFGVAADVASYPDWATGVAAVEVLERDEMGRARLARFEGAASLGVAGEIHRKLAERGVFRRGTSAVLMPA